VQHKKDAELELANIFEGSENVALAEKADGVIITARFSDLEALRAALGRLAAKPRTAE